MAMSLWEAASICDEEQVRALLFEGGNPSLPALDFDPNEIGSDGHTPLSLAIEYDFFNIVELLLQHPSTDINLPGSFERPPLFLACQLNKPEYVSLLLAADKLSTPLDINLPHLDGATPLLVACESGNHDLIRMLLTHPEIDPTIADFNGSSPLLIACLYQDLELVKLLLPAVSPRIPKTLRGGGGGGGEPANDPSSPLFLACSQENPLLLQLLCKEGTFNPNVTKDDGQTPLFTACQTGNPFLVKTLLSSTSQINVDIPVNVSLSIKLVGQQSWTDFLLAFDQDWVTAEELAKEKNFREIWEVLLEYKADPSRCQQRLRKELGFAAGDAAYLFGLMAFASDGLLVINKSPRKETEDARRFFGICSQLHLDLQMVVCNRAQGLGGNIIPFLVREQAFRTIAQELEK